MKGPVLIGVVGLCATLFHNTAMAKPSYRDDGAFTATAKELLKASEAAELLAREADAKARKKQENSIEDDMAEAAASLLEETVFSYDTEGRQTHTYRHIYLVRHERLVDSWSAVEQQYAPWHENKPKLRARVISPDGTVRELDQSTLSDSVVDGHDNNMYIDSRRVRGPLPTLTVGSVVEEYYEVSEHVPFSEQGRAHTFYESTRSPGSRGTLRVDVPIGHDLSWSMDLPDVEIREFKNKESHGFQLEYRAPNRKDYVFRPSPPTDKPSRPTLSFSTAKSWADVARGYSEHVEELFDEEAGAKLIEGLELPKDRTARLAAITERLHERVRYTGIEFGQRAIVPWSPAKVLDRGFGDCKDKAVLLISALRSAGIEADVVLLHAGTEYGMSASPGLDGFNHAIVRVRGQEPVYIDATVTNTAIGTLPRSDQGRPALIITPQTQDLVHTPVDTSSESTYTLIVDATIPIIGRTSYVEHRSATGWQASSQREGVGAIDAVGLRQWARDYAENYGDHAKTTITLQGTADRLATPFATTHKTETGGALQANGVQFSYVFDLANVLSELPYWLQRGVKADAFKGSTGPVHLTPHTNTQVTNLRYDAHYDHVELPDADDISIGPVHLTRTYDLVADGHLKVTIRLDTGDGVLTIEEARQLNDALNPNTNATRVTVIFRNAAFNLQLQRKYAAAFEHSNEQLRERPQVPSAHMVRALLLLGIGFGDEALLAANEAIERGDNSSLVHLYAAGAVRSDMVGDYIVGDYDRAAVIEHVNAAIAADPYDAGPLLILANHQATNDHGVKYGDGSDLAGALKTLKKYEDLEGPEDLTLFRTEIMLVARDFPGVIEATASKPPKLMGYRLAALSHTKGLGAAQKEAATFGSQAGAVHLNTAGLVCMGTGDVDLAIQLMEAGSSVGPIDPAKKALINKLRAIEADVDPLQRLEGPELLATSFLMAVNQGASLKELKALVHQEALVDYVPIDMQMFLRSVNNSVPVPVVDIDVWIDIAAHSMRPTIVESFEDRLFMVHVKTFGSDGSRVIVLGKGKKAKVAATSAARPTLVALARKLYKNQDYEALGELARWTSNVDDSRAVDHKSWATSWAQLHKDLDKDSAAVLVALMDRDTRSADVMQRAIDSGKYEGDALIVLLAKAGRDTYFNRDFADSVTHLAAARERSAHPKVYAYSYMRSLVAAGRVDDAVKVARDYDQKNVTDSPSMECSALELAGQQDRAVSCMKREVEAHPSSTSKINDLAWLLLTRANSRAEALVVAETMVTVSGEPAKNLPLTQLHTLAMAYAMNGRLGEAYGAMRIFKSSNLANDSKTQQVWMMVRGAMAKSIGLRETAIKLLEESADSDEPSHDKRVQHLLLAELRE